MSIPVDTLSVSPLTVPDLLKKYQAGEITLQQLSDLFTHSVIWEYRGIEGDLKWSAVNSWETVHQAMSSKTITSEDYLFLSRNFEAHISGGETVLTRASTPPVVIPVKRGWFKRKPKIVKISKKDAKVKTIHRSSEPAPVVADIIAPVAETNNVVELEETTILDEGERNNSVSDSLTVTSESFGTFTEAVKIVGGLVSPPRLFHGNSASNSEDK